MMDYRLMAVTFVAPLICLIGGASMENTAVYGTNTYLSNPTIFPPTETNVSLIRFYLWTRDNPIEDDYDELFVDDEESILNSHFDGGKKTKVLAHGFTSNGLTSFVRNAREAYLEKEDCNVISVDWEPLARGPNYVKAARNAMPAGARTAKFLQSLMEASGAVLEDFHAIGYSLGGQHVGGLGQAMEGRMKRITALDPAGPMFHTTLTPHEEKLSPEDAEIVDVIHTAGRWLGMDGVVGDIDFYPNGGVASMSGCEGEDVGLGCSHGRAPSYMAESINSGNGFTAWECGPITDFDTGLCDDATTNLMGEGVDFTKRGTFYLRTNPQAPYAMPFKSSGTTLSCALSCIIVCLTTFVSRLFGG